MQADPAAGAKQDKAARKEARREAKRAQREAEIAAARAVLAAARAQGAEPAQDPAAEREGKRRRRDEGAHDRDGGPHRAKHGGSEHRAERRDRDGEHSGQHANGKAADGDDERDGDCNGGAAPRVHHDAASAQGRDLRYGLNHADAVQGYDGRAPALHCTRAFQATCIHKTACSSTAVTCAASTPHMIRKCSSCKVPAKRKICVNKLKIA